MYEHSYLENKIKNGFDVFGIFLNKIWVMQNLYFKNYTGCLGYNGNQQKGCQYDRFQFDPNSREMANVLFLMSERIKYLEEKLIKINGL